MARGKGRCRRRYLKGAQGVREYSVGHANEALGEAALDLSAKRGASWSGRADRFGIYDDCGAAEDGERGDAGRDREMSRGWCLADHGMANGNHQASRMTPTAEEVREPVHG